MTASPKKGTPSLILASGSPRRKELLELFGIPFTVQVSSADEHINANEQPSEIVQTLALRKARDIARQHSDAIVLGADTIVVHQNRILGKPESKAEAQTMLQELSDSTHAVLTGVALILSKDNQEIQQEETFYESTDVTFGNIEPSEIKRYVAGGSPMDKAGAYGIQDDWGAVFVKEIKGDYYNIVGLPLHALYNQLKHFAPALLAPFVD